MQVVLAYLIELIDEISDRFDIRRECDGVSDMHIDGGDDIFGHPEISFALQRCLDSDHWVQMLVETRLVMPAEDLANARRTLIRVALHIVRDYVGVVDAVRRRLHHLIHTRYSMQFVNCRLLIELKEIYLKLFDKNH
jgi:hypothetical protein